MRKPGVTSFWISVVWIGIAAGVFAIAGMALYQGCNPGDCLVERTMLVWIGAALVPFTLIGLGVHLAVVVFLPRAKRRNDPD
jgi:hypothetical protein